MGCTVSQLEDDLYLLQKQHDNSLNQQILLTRAGAANPQFRMILLGPGELGKSTVLKQMELLHKGGFPESKRRQYAKVIWTDVVQLMRQLIIMLRKLKIPLDCDQPDSPLQLAKRVVLRANPLSNADEAKLMTKFIIGSTDWSRPQQTNPWETTSSAEEKLLWGASLEAATAASAVEAPQDSRQDIADAIAKLWTEDLGIRKCYERLNEFQLLTSAEYYFKAIGKFVDPNYLCSDEDILMGRIKTSGITETDFNLKLFNFKVLDAGGQRLERRKWLHYFENITCVLYVMAVSEYDQKLLEDENVNRMEELLHLFDTLCNSQWFQNTPFIIFLNKVDLLEKKLSKLPVKNYFPDFKGRANNVDDAIAYFENRLKLLNHTNKQLYIHRTCATDTLSMKFVINAVTDFMIQDSLRELGLI